MGKQKCCTIQDFEMGIGALTKKVVSVEKLFNLPSFPPDTIVLDLGCGIGYHLKSFSCSKIGLDIAKYNLLKAKNIDREAHFVLGDIEHLPFKANSVDVTYLIEVIHHLPNYRQALKQVKQILKPNGLLLIADEQRDGIAPIFPLMLMARAISHLKGNYAEGFGMPLTKGIYSLVKLDFSILDVRTKGSFAKALLALYTTIRQFPSERRYEEKGFIASTLVMADSILRRIIPPRFLLWYKLTAKLYPYKTQTSIPPIKRDNW